MAGQVRRPDSVEVANYLMERLGKGSTTAELIHPDELVSGIISQVAAEPDMAALFAGFVYSSEGRPQFCNSFMTCLIYAPIPIPWLHVPAIWPSCLKPTKFGQGLFQSAQSTNFCSMSAQAREPTTEFLLQGRRSTCGGRCDTACQRTGRSHLPRSQKCAASAMRLPSAILVQMVMSGWPPRQPACESTAVPIVCLS